ncbi:ZPR1 zinc finger domain-containing protein, partial [archaeon]|nr:ZPR1 zinc finger domain-containing protein [archaeon]
MEKRDKIDHGYNIEIISCPSCLEESAKVVSHILDIPYYDDFAMINIACDKCGYRTSDFMNTKSKDPIKMEYNVENINDETTKIVRSSQGIVRIPELGISIEPNGDGSTWIRNIEGILEDMKQKLMVSKRHAENSDEKRKVKSRLKLLKSLQKFERKFTIVVE